MYVKSKFMNYLNMARALKKSEYDQEMPQTQTNPQHCKKEILNANNHTTV